MKDWFKEFFTFTRKEQRGMGILLALMLLSTIFSTVFPYFTKDEVIVDQAFREEVEKFLKETANSQPDFHREDLSVTNDLPAAPGHSFRDSSFYFDPNKLDREGWQKTGLNDRIISNILRYRQKGGIFKDKEGLARIYGMDDSVFRILEPYILIDDSREEKQPAKKEQRKAWHVERDSATVIRIIELNMADSAELESLPGIGPASAAMIIRYRERLGGFADVRQLLEIKGMDSVRLAGIQDRLSVDPGSVRKMDLNKVEFKVMLKHPYFEYYLVKAIFGYRDKIKAFDSIQQLRNIEAIYPELYEKIEPYLEVRNRN